MQLGGGVTSTVEHENREMANLKAEEGAKSKAEPEGGGTSSMKPQGGANSSELKEPEGEETPFLRPERGAILSIKHEGDLHPQWSQELA